MAATDISIEKQSDITSFLIQQTTKSLLRNKSIKSTSKRKKKGKNKEPLKIYKREGIEYEGGIDEAGRGPMFGRVYSACVILPRNTDDFNHSLMKDSKRFTSKKKIKEAYEYIKQHAIDYCIAYEDESTIDSINILQATQKSMHTAINGLSRRPEHLLIDGNYFNVYSDAKGVIPFTCIEGGDNKYTAIAAASILAKVERDLYIEKMCELNPQLNERYGLLSNKGYGTKKHMEGIKTHGITKWHRRTFGICKNYA